MSDSTGAPTAQDLYLLPSDEVQKQRLVIQHNLLKRSFGWLLLPRIFEGVKPGDRILDCGTGTGIWSLDLSDQLPNLGLTIQGIDISPHLFPSPSPPPSQPSPNPHANANKILFTESSILSLPTSWSNTFSIAHQRLLISAFDESRWHQALSEVYRVLKPGGWIQLVEVDPRIQTCGPAHKEVLGTMRALFEKTGCLFDIADRLVGFLRDVGFELVSGSEDAEVQRLRTPIGKWAGERGGEDGLRIYVDMFAGMIPRLLENGVIDSEDGYRRLLERMREEWDAVDEEVGERCMCEWRVVVARKPRETV